MWYFRCSAIQQSAVVFCICKVAPRSVLDVSSVIQCRIYIVFCNSAAARMLHCVLHLQAGPAWTFQVWFNVVFSVCVASQAPHTVLDVSRTQTHKKHKRHIHTHTHTYRSEGGICFTSRCDVQRVCDHSLFYLGSNNRQRRDGLNKCLTVYSVELMFWTLMRCHGQSC